ncbi:hypothetical protein KTC96_07205 [Clostridium estertheticum]|uniref:hypothetical protein n=1 Tax=Clostridium estertheticum TaxID=238834 RepID=UPI001C7DD4AE|nr:hypothetical protein [Clostridium estertheticum]MBX4260935.1 hypothetical protein [Clostridium estertheticum]WLC71781.1 hypothetical protein KTC96_07205 [Clostridium estertheticum]
MRSPSAVILPSLASIFGVFLMRQNLMALVPVLVLFLFFQKNFIQGMLSGSLKG